MAWVGTSSTNVPILYGGSADLLWSVKSAMLEVGWRLMSFGGGASSGVYQAPNPDGVTPVVDTLTSAESLNVAGAWFRIKEPGSTSAGRELIFQRAAAASLVVKYSKLSGFTGSNTTYLVGEQYSPTTGVGGDGQVVWGTGTDDTAVRSNNGVAGAATSGFVQSVARDAADSNGVWPFYVWSYPSAASRTGSFLFGLDGLIPGSHHPDDLDPCSLLSISLNSTASGTIKYWHGYGRSGGSWVSTGRLCFGGLAGSATSNNWFSYSYRLPDYPAGLSSYDNKVIMVPCGYSTAEISPKWKGLSENILVFNTSEINLRVFNSESNNSRISLLASYSASTNPHAIVAPWTINKEPLR